MRISPFLDYRGYIPSVWLHLVLMVDNVAQLDLPVVVEADTSRFSSFGPLGNAVMPRLTVGRLTFSKYCLDKAGDNISRDLLHLIFDRRSS